MGEHLCWKSSMFWRLWLPSSILADQRVCKDDELASNGDDGGLWGLSGGSQALVEGVHIGIEAGSRERGEIGNGSDARAVAEDDARTLAFTRLIGDRSKAGEHAGLFGGDAAELGETGDQGCRGDEAEAWDRGQDGVATREALVGCDALEDCRIER